MKSKYCIAALFLLVVAMVSGKLMAEPIYFDGFESDALDSIPSGWTHVQGWGGNGAVVGTPVKTGSHSFMIDDVTSSFASGFKTSDFVSPTAGVVEWSFDIYLQATNQHVEALISGNNAIYGGLFFRADGTLGYPSAGAWTVPTDITYTSNEWHNVKIITYLNNSTYSIKFDDATVATDVAAYSATATFNGIILEGNVSAVTSFYVDNVGINIIPEPMTISLLFAGGLATIYSRSRS